MPANRRKHKKPSDGQLGRAEQLREIGIRDVANNPLFASMHRHTHVYSRPHENHCPKEGLAVVTSRGMIHMHPTRIAEPEEWAYIYAHCLLHLAFGHFQVSHTHTQLEWNAACDCYVARFLADLKFGRPPLELRGVLDVLNNEGFSGKTEEQLYDEFCLRGIPASLFPSGTAGGDHCDMIFLPGEESDSKHDKHDKKVDWQACFALGLQEAVTAAVYEVGGVMFSPGYQTPNMSEAQRAKSWFISNYPLLGALAASFSIIEDPLICHRIQISVSAVDMQMREIYINPRAQLNKEELRFVMAHELLHVGLRHDVRCGGRDPYLWNVACDYVINNWLVEMGVGDMPALGGLYDVTLKGESAEAIYDRIVTDMRHYRKLMTLRGTDLSDILGKPGWWAIGDGCDLDDFYRSCLSQGLALHQNQVRGYMPAGLIEEIRALSQPPILWDVKLAQWFDHYFPPLEKMRSYARLSRRQSATPDIPRPLWVFPPNMEDGRTFGVLLDTSGSMDRNILARALGAIASYSMARDVPAARVVFCDAAVYDQGYMRPEDIAEKVRVRGRGGTILQPGIDLLEAAEDFPKDGPLLIITDGFCDKLRIRREHAFLLPEGRFLPFVPRGDVFKIR